MEAVHSIQMAARQSGVSPNLIRVWEQRYSAVEPKRTKSGHRVYSQANIERLALLKELTRAGHSIGNIANLPDDRLRALQIPEQSEERNIKGAAEGGVNSPEQCESWLAEALAAIAALDGRRLDMVLKNGATSMGTHGTLQRLIAPLAERIGEMWREGTLTAAHEHFGSGRIRSFLSDMAKPFASSEHAPVIVVATPAGQLHEMGALIVAAMASNLGWSVTFLGASLPANEIAGAARQKNARAVALSVVYPEDDPDLPKEISTMRELLPEGTALLAGGRAIKSYGADLKKRGAVLVRDLKELGGVLDSLRRR